MSESGRNPLARPLLDAWRTIHSLNCLLDGYRLMTSVSVETIRKCNRELDASRSLTKHLRAELRAAASGRTIAEERQAIQDAETVVGDEHDEAAA